MVRREAGVVGVVLRVDLRTRMEAQDVSPRITPERHNHTTRAREPARLATLREYRVERRELRSLRQRADRPPMLSRARALSVKGDRDGQARQTVCIVCPRHP